ncbi:dynamin family protein [Leptolyngbya sp. Heron Island J]|uniref:dynamin family protein n=1 Tax=Leptolyngbya sp. Heron Island J TaxID=1385935 RepID=UPI0003B9D601|nr:dynamin family protein [Leptolyngbya sp. Heron Island J]ESA36459.1 dynamin family protein [Leptolyngbya sp. Heron Island J]
MVTPRAANANSSMVGSLDALTHRRQQAAQALSQIAIAMDRAETTEQSGQLGLTRHIRPLQSTAEQLHQGKYRIVVLGEMKRGKSTLINALVGESLLPSDVSPCTALLSLLRHGPEPRVILHYNNGTSPQTIDFETFRADYTIPADEARQLETNAFPDISHVVIECPIPLLASGLEIVDTPGLNDTETRNQQVLNYLSEAQAVLFVLDALQPITLDERRYLQNYVQSRDLECFYVVNGWDRIKRGLVNPADETALAEAEQRQRQVFAQGLPTHWFEVSALSALRQRRQGDSLAGSGVDQLLTALETFLTQERGQAEIQQAAKLAQRAYSAVQAAVERRIPLLDADLSELQRRLASVEDEFGKLEKIRDNYRQLIRQRCDRTAQAIANSFKTYILSLEKTFDTDFVASQPDLDFLNFLDENQRNNFYKEFKRAFERYINDQLTKWELTATQTISEVFAELSESAIDYQAAYTQVVEEIQKKMTGPKFYVPATGAADDIRPWIDDIRDLFDAVPDTLNNSVQPLNRFWKSVLQMTISSVCVAIILQSLGLIFTSLFLNIVGVIAALGGILAVQAEFVRQEFIRATRKEFVKHLPQIAADQWQSIYKAVTDCFYAYEEQTVEQISADIAARHLELSSLIEKKQQNEINREQAVARLQTLEETIQQELEILQVMI